jgi:Mrp family chromosome partitioning ATPase
MLFQVNAKILGVVINRVDIRRSQYGGYGYYHGYHSYYAERSEKDKKLPFREKEDSAST